MRYLIPIIAFSVLSLSIQAQECLLCDTEILLDLDESLDKLEYKTVRNFVCTFDKTCINNAEFSEWSNELLFKLIVKDVHMLNRAINEVGADRLKIICSELENPIYDFDLTEIYSIVKASEDFEEITKAEIHALKKAASKGGIELK